MTENCTSKAHKWMYLAGKQNRDCTDGDTRTCWHCGHKQTRVQGAWIAAGPSLAAQVAARAIIARAYAHNPEEVTAAYVTLGMARQAGGRA